MLFQHRDTVFRKKTAGRYVFGIGGKLVKIGPVVGVFEEKEGLFLIVGKGVDNRFLPLERNFFLDCLCLNISYLKKKYAKK